MTPRRAMPPGLRAFLSLPRQEAATLGSLVLRAEIVLEAAGPSTSQEYFVSLALAMATQPFVMV